METEITQLISAGENTTTEFKESFDREAVETAAAFANTSGGVILIGVSDRGEIKGISVGKETLRNWSNQISQATEPRVIPEIESVELDDKQIVVIRIKAFPIKPVSTRGRCLRRVSASNRVMTPQEITQMHLSATRQSWDRLVTVEASIDEIDFEKVRWYLARRGAVRNIAKPQDMSVTELLGYIRDTCKKGSHLSKPIIRTPVGEIPKAWA